MSPLVVEQEVERERKRKTRTITKTVWGPYARSPQVQYVYAPYGLSVPSNVCDGQTKKNKQKDKLGPVAPGGVDPRTPNFQGM